jgi:hypothetical protein
VVTTAACVGVELVQERTAIAERASQKLQLQNVTIHNTNALDPDLVLEDVDFFFMYAPFSRGTFTKVLGRLRHTAEARQAAGLEPFTIAARLSRRLERERWLRKSHHQENAYHSPLICSISNQYPTDCQTGSGYSFYA